ncbi:MAG: hypothetical protein ABI778_01870 [Ignavibacteriota bacterium]
MVKFEILIGCHTREGGYPERISQLCKELSAAADRLRGNESIAIFKFSYNSAPRMTSANFRCGAVNYQLSTSDSEILSAPVIVTI